MSLPIVLRMPSDDNHLRDDTYLSEIPKEVHNNNSEGVFYQVNGIQNVYHCPHSAPRNTRRDGVMKEGVTSETTYDEGVDTGNRNRESEPYQTVIDSLSRMKHRLLTLSKRFPLNSTITSVCSEADELVPLVRGVARTMCQIEDANPNFITHSFFFYLQLRAFKYTSWLKQLEKRLDEYKPRQHSRRARRKGENVAPCSWPCLSQDLQKFFHVYRTVTRRFLRALLASRFLECFDIEVAGLKGLMASLMPAQDFHHPQVDTIWVRGPTVKKWFSIPLRFCKTWKDFATVIHQYCREGPEVEYIAQGNWAIVHVADNNIIDQKSFTGALKPEMRFDIGIIVQLLSAMLCATQCPQCGHVNGGGPPRDGWINCSNLDCNNLFRIVFNLSKRTHIDTVLRSSSTHGECRIDGVKRYQTAPLAYDATRIQLAKVPPKLSTLPLSETQHPSTLQESDHLYHISGEEHAELPYLNTKFHRILANVLHSPAPEDLKAPMPHVGDEDLSPVPSLGSHTGEIGSTTATTDTLDRLKMEVEGPVSVGFTNSLTPTKDIVASGAEVVRRLTKSNNETFACLKVFCGKYREKKHFGMHHSHRHERRIYKHVVEQAGIYVGTIDTSLGIAEKGIAICRDIKAMLDDPKLELLTMAEFMLGKAKEVLSDVGNMWARFRVIRMALYDEIQRVSLQAGLEIHGPEKSLYTEEQEFNLQELKRMGDEDLLHLTVAVLDRFVLIVGNFIDWWGDLRTNVGSLTTSIEFMRKNPAISTRVRTQWDNVEKQYKAYNSEIMDQQDYYHKTLTDLVVPVSLVHRMAHRVAHGVAHRLRLE